MNRTMCEPRQALRICRRKACHVKASNAVVISSSRCPVPMLIAPKIVLLEWLPLTGTVASVPTGASAARRGGISVIVVASDISITAR